MLLEKLTNASGVSGHEGPVRKIIIEAIKDHVDSFEIDRMGNIIAYKNIDKKGKHIGLSAHMDEVGLIVRGIDSTGLIHIFARGVDPRVLVAKKVKVGEKEIPGVIGSKPIHVLTPAERKIALTAEQLYVDIGAKSKEEAEKHVNRGDYIVFDSDYRAFGEYKVKAKALDDRVGCGVMVEILQSEISSPITAMFVVQEEVGLRGSATAAYAFNGELIINLEGTICADMIDTPSHHQVTVSGAGPAISLADRSSIYLAPYVRSMEAVAKKHQIPWQHRKAGSGGTDAGSYHTRKTGVPVIGLSVPCRYIHSPVSVMDIRDYKHMIALVKAYIEDYNKEDLIHG